KATNTREKPVSMIETPLLYKRYVLVIPPLNPIPIFSSSRLHVNGHFEQFLNLTRFLNIL
ncbi:MAG: hypothetical protein AAB968_00725, partial [Patescibacteria group bacterium]